MKVPVVKLSDNRKMPGIGLGTWKVPQSKAADLVAKAIKAGWRHIDTAQIYRNERGIGQGIEDSGIDRGEIFITTKIWNGNQGQNHFGPSLEKSLSKLRTDYVDLLLLHWPVSKTRHEAWRRMEQAQAAGQALSIGVSNYTVRHLKELLAECSVRPAVNQVELHVFLQQPDLLSFCHQEGITVEAYSPLAHGHELDDETLRTIAKKHDKSTAQVMIRWAIDNGTVPLPKTSHEERLSENLDVFDFKLDAADLKQLKRLERGYRTCWNPMDIP